MEMPDVIYATKDNEWLNSTGFAGRTTEYHHSRTLEALKAENSVLKQANELLRKEGRKIPIRMNRSIETNNEGTFITEYVYLGDEAIDIIHKKNEELLAKVAELEAVMEARGM